jgi:hypothetical protein
MAVHQARYSLRKRVFEHSTSGAESMKVDGSSGTIDENVWNGEGSYWADPTIGSKTTGSKRTGTYGWDTGVTAQNDEVKFTRSTPFQPTSDAIEGWINLQAYPAGVEIQGRWELAGVTKGNGVDLMDYLESQDLGVWQHFSIPLSDFNLPAENVDEFRFRTKNVAGADYYLDDITLNSGGGSQKFRLVVPSGAEWIVGSITLVLVAGDSGWNSNAFANIAGGLANGLTLRHRDLVEGENQWKVVCKKNIHLFGHFDPVIDTTYNDNQRQISFVLRPSPADIIVTENETLELLVKDDLTSLTDLRAFAHVGVVKAAS